MAAAEDIGQNCLARSVIAEIFTSFTQFSPEKGFTSFIITIINHSQYKTSMFLIMVYINFGLLN
jgi:hypothetical protein